ncbi:MAG: aminoglycoside phosphotransferase family protein [Kiritimatiellae bacterium]|nr:aminoglycoside phosphotransferase family protein [Kiritimatiellia bacterium]
MRKKAEKKAEVKIEKKEVKAARKAAKASREPKAAKCSKKSANVLLERTDKVVTRDKDTVLKIFGPSYKVSAVLNEAMNEARAAETGLPVARVLEVLKVRDQWCIRREWVEGKTLAETMAGDKKNLVRYLKEFVAIQCEIFSKTSERMGNLADKLDKQISASDLPKETRYDLHMRLQSMPRGKALCHGDFNPTNVIITPKGEWRVIDWSHVRLGDPLADVARTYLLFWLSGHVAAAEKYMSIACDALKAKISDVQKWLPIVAAAESSKEQQSVKNHELLLHWASVVDYE